MKLLDLLDDVVGVEWLSGAAEYVFSHGNLRHTFLSGGPRFSLIWLESKAANGSQLCVESGFYGRKHGLPDVIARVLGHGNLRMEGYQSKVCLSTDS